MLAIGAETCDNLIGLYTCSHDEDFGAIGYFLRCLTLYCFGLEGKAYAVEDLLGFGSNCIVIPASRIC